MERRVAWELLGLDSDELLTHDRLRRTYLRRLRAHPPERDPEGFRRLREAFELLEPLARMVDRLPTGPDDAGAERAAAPDPARERSASIIWEGNAGSTPEAPRWRDPRRTADPTPGGTTAEPAAAKRSAAEPVATKPVIAEPVAAKPVIAEPAAAKRSTAEPVAAKPVIAEPAVAKPVIAEPAAAKRDAGELPTTKPVTDDATLDELIAEAIATDEPSADEPVADEPVADDLLRNRRAAPRPVPPPPLVPPDPLSSVQAVTDELLARLERGELDAALELADRWHHDARDDHRDVTPAIAERWVLTRELIEVAAVLPDELCRALAHGIAIAEPTFACRTAETFRKVHPGRASDLDLHLAKRAGNLHKMIWRELRQPHERRIRQPVVPSPRRSVPVWALIAIGVSAALRAMHGCDTQRSTDPPLGPIELPESAWRRLRSPQLTPRPDETLDLRNEPTPATPDRAPPPSQP